MGLKSKTPKDYALNSLANTWASNELPDDGDLTEEFEELRGQQHGRTTRPADTVGKTTRHVRFFDQGTASRYGVYFTLCRRQVYVAYTKSGQTAARLADVFTRHFWWTRRRVRSPEPTDADMNFSVERADYDMNYAEVADWLARLEPIMVEREYFPSKTDIAMAPEPVKRESRLKRMERDMAELLVIAADCQARLKALSK